MCFTFNFIHFHCVHIEVKVTDRKEKRCREKKLKKNMKVTRAAMLGYQTDPV